MANSAMGVPVVFAAVGVGAQRIADDAIGQLDLGVQVGALMVDALALVVEALVVDALVTVVG